MMLLPLRRLFALILKAIIVFEILVNSMWHIVCEKNFVIRVHFLYTQLGSSLVFKFIYSLNAFGVKSCLAVA